ncbi:esterase [Lewinellaceae bacterium SD302]|nr:esterase [Lewinellaceae bacterium SD302]
MRSFLLTLLLLPAFLSAQIQAISAPLTIGETLSLQSKILGEERKLNVYLPTYYQYDSLKNYPVIYLLDGSMDEDFMHVAGLVQFCSFSWINDLPESILVGIANVDRKRDFTYPTRNRKDRKEFPTTGGSAKFIDFLKNEVQPLINERFRTNDTTTIIGQSLGGLLATEILFKQPALFDNYVIISPSLWWDDQSLLKYPLNSRALTKNIFVGVGKEGEIMENDARALYNKVKAREDGINHIHFQYFPQRDHGDALHEALYRAFELLFKLKNLE